MAARTAATFATATAIDAVAADYNTNRLELRCNTGRLIAAELR